LERPGSFFADIGKAQIKGVVDLIGYDTLRFPFGPHTALGIIASYRNQLATNAQYSLSKISADQSFMIGFRSNFNIGGWNGFLLNTQYPQNNYMGFKLMIEDDLSVKLQGVIQAPAQKVQNLLQQGMGFLSPQRCPTNEAYNNGTNEFIKPTFKPKTQYDHDDEADAEGATQASLEYKRAVSYERAEWEKEHTCPGGLVNTTPGSVAANQIMMAMGSSFRQSELAASLGNSLSAIFDALINNFINKGLNALSSTMTSKPEIDTWTYGGQGFGSSTGTASLLTITSNDKGVIQTEIGRTTTAPLAIVGGTGRYFIRNQIAASNLAKITMDDKGNISVTGIREGSADIVIEDSSNPKKAGVIRIEVYDTAGLRAIPSNVEIKDPSESVTVTIHGGKPQYNITTGPSESIAKVSFTDSILVISGVGPGTTEVKITDAENKSITIPIEVKGTDTAGDGFTTDPSSIKVVSGKNATAQIVGGTSPYTLGEISGIAFTHSITGNTLQITAGYATGTGTLTLTDKDNKKATVSVQIIPDPALVKVTPEQIFMYIGNTKTANITGGTAPYSIKTYGPYAKESESDQRVRFTITGNVLTITGVGTKTVKSEAVISDSKGATFKVYVKVDNFY
jgi:hypothetical protein